MLLECTQMMIVGQCPFYAYAVRYYIINFDNLSIPAWNFCVLFENAVGMKILDRYFFCRV